MNKNKPKHLMTVLIVLLIYWVGGFNPLPCEEKKDYKENVKNFIYFREVKKNKKVQEYRLGESYLTDINIKNQLQIIIDTDYLQTQDIAVHNKRLKIEPSYEFDRKTTEQLKVSEILFDGDRILSNDPVIFYIEDLGLQEGDKLKIKVSFEAKDSADRIILSANEIKFKIKRVGLKMHTSETLAFVRDSFSKNWKPQPGTSITFGFTSYVTKQTPGIFKFTGRAWNFIDPRLGINLSLLDFDDDKNLEIGLGPVVSVMKGAFYFGVGWNFTTSRSKNQYAFFGMSITEVTTILKSIISK